MLKKIKAKSIQLLNNILIGDVLKNIRAMREEIEEERIKDRETFYEVCKRRKESSKNLNKKVEKIRELLS